MARSARKDTELEINVDAFNGALRDMSRRLSNTTTMQQVVDYEVGRIVNKAIRLTTKATKLSIKRSDAARPPWRTYDLGRGRKKYYLENRYPNAIWAKIQARLRESLALKYNARELARRVWAEIVKKLGQKLEATAQTQSARSGTFQAASAAGVERFRGTNSYGVEIENSYGKNRWVNASQALFAAIAGRRKQFEGNVARGVFDDLKKVEKQYPGLTITY